MHTSVPVEPIAIPMSAFFNATTSLTPSPVIATTSPRFCNALKIRLNLKFGQQAVKYHMEKNDGIQSSATIRTTIDVL